MNATSTKAPWYPIVGVVRDVRDVVWTPPRSRGVYLLVDQPMNLWGVPIVLAMRTAGDPLAFVKSRSPGDLGVDREQPIN